MTKAEREALKAEFITGEYKLRFFLCKNFNFGNHCCMDALFSKNVEDKEVFFKKMQNTEGIVEGRLENTVGNNENKQTKNAEQDNV